MRRRLMAAGVVTLVLALLLTMAPACGGRKGAVTPSAAAPATETATPLAPSSVSTPASVPSFKQVSNTYSNTNIVTSFAFDGNHLWAGTSGGVLLVDTANQTYVKYTPSNSGLAGNSINAVAVDGAGKKWFGGYGVSQFDGNTWVKYTTADSGLADDWVTAIAIDNAGNKWFGTYKGVSKFDGNNWTTYTTANSRLAGNRIHAIAADSAGNKWFGTDKGASKFDGNNWTNYPDVGLGTNWVDAIAIDDGGNTWFGGVGGASKFDGRTWTTYTPTNSGLADHAVNVNVRAIAIDQAGNKWFGTGNGVSVFGPGQVPPPSPQPLDVKTNP